MGDEAAIANLVFGYAERIDAGDFDGVAALLADAELTAEGGGPPTRGRDAVADFYRRSVRLHPGGTPLTKHVTTNLIIEVAPARDTASCRSYFTVLQAVPDELALQPIIAGRYRDRFARDGEGGWRFAARHMVVDLVGDLRSHLAFALLPPPPA